MGTNDESSIQKSILDWLAYSGYYAWRNYVGPVIHGFKNKPSFSKNPARGMPDIMGIMKNGSGRLFAIEVKTKKGVLSPIQKDRLTALNENGALAFVARDLETVVNTLREADN